MAVMAAVTVSVSVTMAVAVAVFGIVLTEGATGGTAARWGGFFSACL